jgi:hypothetical protein
MSIQLGFDDPNIPKASEPVLGPLWPTCGPQSSIFKELLENPFGDGIPLI